MNLVNHSEAAMAQSASEVSRRLNGFSLSSGERAGVRACDSLPVLATVITCPQRWEHYQRMRRNFTALKIGLPLRTFQTKDCLGNAYANNNLNARAALAYADKHLPADGWLLYLEDDVILHPALASLLPELVRVGDRESVDFWNLCNRKNTVWRQFHFGELVVNELAYPAFGSHGLLIPKRHLLRILAAHWADVSDLAMFATIHHVGWKMWQVVRPVLVEHIGVVSTYAPDRIKTLEINHAA